MGPTQINRNNEGEVEVGCSNPTSGWCGESTCSSINLVLEKEKLLKASQCYLSTTAGPIAGLLFISTDKVAFCSDRSIRLSTLTGESFRYHYKVMIPIRKIKNAKESENVKKPSRKYMELVTKDKMRFGLWDS